MFLEILGDETSETRVSEHGTHAEQGIARFACMQAVISHYFVRALVDAAEPCAGAHDEHADKSDPHVLLLSEQGEGQNSDRRQRGQSSRRGEGRAGAAWVRACTNCQMSQQCRAAVGQCTFVQHPGLSNCYSQGSFQRSQELLSELPCCRFVVTRWPSPSCRDSCSCSRTDQSLCSVLTNLIAANVHPNFHLN